MSVPALDQTVLIARGGSVAAARIGRTGRAAGERESGGRHEGETGDEVTTSHVGSCKTRAGCAHGRVGEHLNMRLVA